MKYNNINRLYCNSIVIINVYIKNDKYHHIISALFNELTRNNIQKVNQPEIVKNFLIIVNN